MDNQNRVARKVSIALLAVGIFVLGGCGSSEGPYSNQFKGKIKREAVGIAGKVPGRILDIRVEETDTVSRGDTLAVLDIPEVEAKLRQAEGAWLSARAQYQMVKNGTTPEEKRQVKALLEAAKQQYELAGKTFDRMKGMYEDTLIAPQKFDEVQAKYQAARAKLEQAEAKSDEVESGIRKERIEMARGQLTRAQGVLDEARTAYDERFITAPSEMSIETIALEEGELALPGYSIFTGYKRGLTYLRFTIPESRIASFKEGNIYSIHQPFQDRPDFKARLTGVKQLARYANQSSAYPQYELGEAIYELKLVPENKTVAEDLYVNTTVLMNKSD